MKCRFTVDSRRQLDTPLKTICHENFQYFSEFNGCYRKTSDRVTWRTARERCMASSADLVTIESSRKQRFIMELVKSNSGTYIIQSVLTVLCSVVCLDFFYLFPRLLIIFTKHIASKLCTKFISCESLPVPHLHLAHGCMLFLRLAFASDCPSWRLDFLTSEV